MAPPSRREGWGPRRAEAPGVSVARNPTADRFLCIPGILWLLAHAAGTGGPAGRVGDSGLAVVVLTVGTIVFVAAHISLKHSPLVSNTRGRDVVAFCAAALSVIGLIGTSPGRFASAPPELDARSFPYTAIGIAFLLVVLLLVVARLSRRLMRLAADLRSAAFFESKIKSNRNRRSHGDGDDCGVRAEGLARIRRIQDRNGKS